MTEAKEQFVTTLLFPNEYQRHFNQVSGLTSQKIVYLKRKFVSRSGYELVSFPVSECVQITYYDERPPLTIILGIELLLLITVCVFGLIKYQQVLLSVKAVPIGLLFLGCLYAGRAIFKSRRHRIVFSMRDGTRLTWKTRPGDYKHKEPNATKVVEFARTLGILGAPGTDRTLTGTTPG